ncbi:MAG: cysteine--tRNA ligase [Candidatus Diapherotrites archaeon]|nr:cysteine--tRNA ligase [Candidatus Diapherotrites archaeon]
MSLKLYNTLSRKKESFKPEQAGIVRMYVCGPTVNDVPHLGHARQQVVFDILRKFLKFSGYDVKFVSNITDIEDKIINKAKELNEDIKSLTERNLKEHLEDYGRLNVQKPDVQPKATEYIKEMIELVGLLEKKGFTYVIPNDGVYYEISKFKNYGKLSHQNVEDLKKGVSRVESNAGKKNPEDFVLWKFSKPGEPFWPAPWGSGRPGWHIECSAMSAKILGLPLDIHGGGQDLIFPHHEDEIAQSEAAFRKKFVNYWVHNGMVNVEKIKMSKSLGNFKTIKDLLKEYSGETLRYFIISTHYRKPVDFSKQLLDKAKIALEKLKNNLEGLQDDGKTNGKYLKLFEEAMDSDLNTPKALRALQSLVKDKSAEGKFQAIQKIDSVFCLRLLDRKKVEIPAEIQLLADERENARKAKDWKKADELRDLLKQKGYFIADSAEGPKVKKIE